jgi:Fe-S cluster assembly iron-binding protein IscA
LDWDAGPGERRSSLTLTAEATPSLASIADQEGREAVGVRVKADFGCCFLWNTV